MTEQEGANTNKPKRTRRKKSAQNDQTDQNASTNGKTDADERRPTMAGQSDIFTAPLGQGGGGNPAKELIVMPEELKDWIARTIIDADRITDWGLMLADMYATKFGFVPWEKIMWFDAGLRISEDGQGREEYREVLTGGMQRSFFGGFMDKMGNPFGIGANGDQQQSGKNLS